MTKKAKEPVGGDTADEASAIEESIDAVMEKVSELVAPTE